MTRAEAARMAQDLLQALDERVLLERIDQPVDQAAASFQYDRQTAFSYQQFVRVSADFLDHLFRQAGLPLPCATPEQINNEVVVVLEMAFGNPKAPGYDIAYFEALAGLSMDGLLASMAMAVKANERAKYDHMVRSQFLHKMLCLSWPERLMVVEAVMEMCAPSLGPIFQGYAPSRMMPHLPNLVTEHLKTQRRLAMMFGN